MEIETLQGQFPGYMYRGKFYPAIMGGDGTDDSDVGTEIEEIEIDEEDGIEGQGSSEHSLYDDFLQGVPEGSRGIIEPFVKDWDAQVTRKFQEYSDKLKPYEEVGLSPEELSQASELAIILQENPEVLYQILKTHFEAENPETPPTNLQPPQQPIQGQPQDDRPEYVKTLEEKLEAQENLLRILAEKTITEQQTLQLQQQDSELDALLEDIQKRNEVKLTEIEQKTLMAGMLAGEDPDVIVTAIKENQAAIREAAIAEMSKQPYILSGSNVVPDLSQKVTELASKDVRSIVAQMVSQRNEAANG